MKKRYCFAFILLFSQLTCSAAARNENSSEDGLTKHIHDVLVELTRLTVKYRGALSHPSVKPRLEALERELKEKKDERHKTKINNLLGSHTTNEQLKGLIERMEDHQRMGLRSLENGGNLYPNDQSLEESMSNETKCIAALKDELASRNGQ